MGKLPRVKETTMRPLGRKPTGDAKGKNTFLVGVFFLCLLSHCHDCDGGEFSISPSLTLREEYDDNIFLTKNDKVNDFVTRITPSVNLTYRTPIWDLILHEKFEWWYYAKEHDSQNSNDANLSSKLTVIKNLLYFDVTDTYSNVVLNPRGPSTPNNLTVNKTDSNTLNANPYMKYQLDPATAVLAGYTYTNIWYRSSDGINRQQHKGNLTLEHLFSEKLRTLLWVEYVADRPEREEPNNDQAAVIASAVYTVDPRTKIDGTAGYRWIRFSGGQDHNEPVYNGGVAYQFAENGQVELRASQLVSTSPTDGVVENAEQKVAVNYGKSLAVNATVYHRRNNYIEIGQTDKATGVEAGLAYMPNPRTAYRISGRYEKDRYLPQDNSRDIYGASARAEYKLAEKTVVSLTYDYNRSTGQVETDNYTDNIIGLQLRIEL